MRSFNTQPEIQTSVVPVEFNDSEEIALLEQIFELAPFLPRNKVSTFEKVREPELETGTYYVVDLSNYYVFERFYSTPEEVLESLKVFTEGSDGIFVNPITDEYTSGFEFLVYRLVPQEALDKMKELEIYRGKRRGELKAILKQQERDAKAMEIVNKITALQKTLKEMQEAGDFDK